MSCRRPAAQEIRVDKFFTHYALCTNHPLAGQFGESRLALVPRGIAAASTLANSVSHLIREDSDPDLMRQYLLERKFDPSDLIVTAFALPYQNVDRDSWGSFNDQVVSGINSQWQANCQAHGERGLPTELSYYDGPETLQIHIRVEEPIALPFPPQTHRLVVCHLTRSAGIVPMSAIFVADQLAQLRAIQQSIEAVQAQGIANAHHGPLVRRLAADEEALVQARSSVLFSTALYFASMIESRLEEPLKFNSEKWLETYREGAKFGSRWFGTQEAVNLNGRFLIQYRRHFPAWFDAAVQWWIPGECEFSTTWLSRLYLSYTLMPSPH
ncbi:hypothetical protein JCM11491_005659 [Sporobolomyces phaffii]